MTVRKETIDRLASIPNVSVSQGVPLSRHTRFGIGGPAAVFAEAVDEEAFTEAVRMVQSSGAAYCVIGDGTNLIISDEGFDGIVLRQAANLIYHEDAIVRAQAGAELQALVDYCIDHGLRGLETMTGIPGSVGGAVYGNAGAYGHSIDECVRRVRFLDGPPPIRSLRASECEFRYRESVFKQHKEWIIVSTDLEMQCGDRATLREAADKILSIRNKKYPPTMKCAGSIFKNFLLAELPAPVVNQIPANVIIEGKVPSAWFLERVGAKGMQAGDIHVADYHANLIYNAGQGIARDLVEIITELKQRVERRWGIPLEEEVQYVGFPVTI
jgi:UDP-N-acetylmuramate dehydrogenase